MRVEGIQLLIEPAELAEQLLVSGPEFGAQVIWRSWGRGQSADHFYEVEAAVFTGVHGLSDGSWRAGACAVALADGHGRWGDEQAVAAQLAHHRLDAGNLLQTCAEASRAAPRPAVAAATP